MNASTVILTFFASLGGAAGIAFLVVRYLGKKIIDNQFEKSIEIYRFKIDSKFDRISKIHEKEFDFLPKLWESLVILNNDFNSLTALFQSFPDLDRFSALELREFFASKNLKESEIEKIYLSTKKLDAFIDIDYWNKINKMNKSLVDFSYLFFQNKIFLTDELEKLLENIRVICIGLYSNLSVANSNGTKDYALITKTNEDQKKLVPLLSTLSSIIKRRLCFYEAFE